MFSDCVMFSWISVMMRSWVLGPPGLLASPSKPPPASVCHGDARPPRSRRRRARATPCVQCCAGQRRAAGAPARAHGHGGRGRGDTAAAHRRSLVLRPVAGGGPRPHRLPRDAEHREQEERVGTPVRGARHRPLKSSSL